MARPLVGPSSLFPLDRTRRPRPGWHNFPDLVVKRALDPHNFPEVVARRQDVGVPSPPPPDVVELHDHTPDEIESPAELALHLRAGTLAGKTVKGIDLSGHPLSTVDVGNTLFIGCKFASV